jgi:VIT1/CCC1 family predicted Fe2+/Mn2+ transporter
MRKESKIAVVIVLVAFLFFTGYVITKLAQKKWERKEVKAILDEVLKKEEVKTDKKVIKTLVFYADFTFDVFLPNAQ